MLRTLSIRDFVIVDALELEFDGGFSALTGETGAGKSILIDALTLALGGRSDARAVRENAQRADISAEFSLDNGVQDWLKEHEFNGDEDSVLLRRVIDSNGRSRAFINGVAATSNQLRELGEMLVDIHGQHAHQGLLKTNNQRQLLDRHANLEPQVRAVGDAYRNWQTLARQLEESAANAEQIASQKEHLQWQVDELEKLALQEGEWEEITQEHTRLSHAASLMEGAQHVLAALAEAEQPLISELCVLHQKLSKLSDIDATLAPSLEMLDSARIQMQEAAYALNHYLSRADLDPQRLHEVEARMDALHSAARRLRVQPEALPAEFERLSAQLEALVLADDIEALQAQVQTAEAAYYEQAQQLSAARAEAAKALGKAITDAMQDLSMTGGSFAAELIPCEAGANGLEQIEFQVTAHAGTALRPLAKIASGGELARISLAISVITSSASATPTLIFDEVDSGIGGAVAEVVGKRLHRLGSDCQVLCVTHLPQVASQAMQHFQVSKHTDDAGAPVSQIEPLDTDARVEEIARMLGGVEITDTTRRHAKEMLSR